MKHLLVPFQSIFKKENGNPVPSNINDNTSLKKYFQEILPNYDKERVYVSNIKKVISWYNILIKHNLIDIEEPQAEAQTETTDNENN